MPTAFSFMSSRPWTRVGAILVVGFFCLPLFVGLGEQDLRNDEAIYSYSVDRMLETGQWLTPRAIPFDGPFLEKPPLKLWIVAGLIQAGVLPHDEIGLRAVDVLFGMAAFLYVYAIGALLAGPICGAASVFVLFAFAPLLVDHGVRSNNMESALLLAYCGGIYHLVRWDSAVDRRRQIAHALTVGAYIALGFMTKFVAVFFLPLVCAAALVWRRDGWPRLRKGWVDWLGAAALAVALSAPWFVIEYLRSGRMLWNIMLRQHVVTRFTASLDPSHVQPWTYYFVAIWQELTRFHLHWIVAVGIVVLAWRAWTGRPWLARVLLLWFILPMVLISTGTSKLFHYTYPFVPPLALGVGFIVASLVTALTGDRWASVLGRLGARPSTVDRRSGALVLARRALVVVGALALALAVWTVIDGRVVVDLGGSHFSNSSIGRPLVIGACLLWLGAAPFSALHTWVVVPLLVLLALPTYEGVVSMLRRADHPLHSMRDCMLAVQRTDPMAGRGLYNAAHARAGHPYFYYLRHVGPWRFAEGPAPDEVRRRLLDPQRQSPVIVTQEALGDVMAAVADGAAPSVDVAPAALHQSSATPLALVGVMNDDGVVIVLPGPYQQCMPPAVAAGWRMVGDVAPSGGGR